MKGMSSPGFLDHCERGESVECRQRVIRYDDIPLAGLESLLEIFDRIDPGDLRVVSGEPDFTRQKERVILGVLDEQ